MGRGRSVDELNLNGKIKGFGLVFKQGFLLNRPSIKGVSASFRQESDACGPVGSDVCGKFSGGSNAATGIESNLKEDSVWSGKNLEDRKKFH